jgi:hypothetical protein
MSCSRFQITMALIRSRLAAIRHFLTSVPCATQPISGDALSCARSHPIQNRTSGFTASKCILFPHGGCIVFFCETTPMMPWSSQSLSWNSAYRRSRFTRCLRSRRCVRSFSLLIILTSSWSVISLCITLRFHLEGITRVQPSVIKSITVRGTNEVRLS